MYERKIIDIRRSFIPINANEFPETLHATGREDWPEDRVPVIPYKGYNFLPTSYGYRSYFGLNFKFNSDSLLPNRSDAIFLFQTLAYKNIVIALCDTGIWAKNVGDDVTTGWTQLVIKDVPAEGIFFEWYYTTIRNKLYLFRTNDTAFYEIETDITNPLGVVVNTLVPTFITLTAQLGMFRLGSRLGFWDGTNAVATSSADDLSDFTPNILTGANVTTFNSVIGKISSIKPHGKHAIIYASKSVVFLQLQPGDTFLVKASPILQDTGVPYSRQSVVAIPDSLHFAYTSTGIYKIEEAKSELIVPEVYDYFKRFTVSPIYLKLLQGRYLCFECIDPRAIDGDAQFSIDETPSSVLTFPPVPDSLDVIQTSDPTTIDQCGVLARLSTGDLTEQQNLASLAIPEGVKSGTAPTPVWTCYLSRIAPYDSSNLQWSSNPCGTTGANGEVFDMSPVGGPIALSQLTTDATNKTAVTGDEAYSSGGWTMQRFLQVQTALWQLQEDAINSFMNLIKGRAFFSTKVTPGATGCVIAPSANTYCTIDEYVTKFSPPQFGYNTCSFWLTRYALETEKIRSRFTSEVQCDTSADTNIVVAPIGYAQIFSGTSNGIVYGSPGAALAGNDSTGLNTMTPIATSRGVGGDNATYDAGIAGLGSKPVVGYANVLNRFGENTGAQIAAVYPVVVADGIRAFGPTSLTAAGVMGVPTMALQYVTGHSTKTEIKSAANEVETLNTGILGVETAFCEITGWNYTDKNGKPQFKPAAACTDVQDKYPGSVMGGAARQVPKDEGRPLLTNPTDGSMCGVPFELPDLGGFDNVTWPDQSVTFPAVPYLLQVGSIAPMYPTIVGAFTYDLHLKKWGKFKTDYKLLVEMLPINSESTVPVQKDNFGILAGCYTPDGFIYIFDEKPASSKLTWGKIGYYRLGMTDLKEVQMVFARTGKGSVEIECSIDGTNLKLPLTEKFSFNGFNVVAHPKYSAKWYNISVTGVYDVVELVTDVSRKGRR